MSHTIPSWQRWPPNCCETCEGWNVNKENTYIGTCYKGDSLEFSTTTDSRFRCPAFVRKADKVSGQDVGSGTSSSGPS